jgi:hypothetical protein
MEMAIKVSQILPRVDSLYALVRKTTSADRAVGFRKLNQAYFSICIHINCSRYLAAVTADDLLMQGTA